MSVQVVGKILCTTNVNIIILNNTEELKNAYSSHCKSRVSLTRSRKQPSECMLSNTSGSSSVRDEILLTHTRLGGGCSGHGSLRPPLGATHISHKATHTSIVHVTYYAIALKSVFHLTVNYVELNLYSQIPGMFLDGL